MKLCEVYESLQGEGPNTGEPTTFVRFGGCNLRCPGWGRGVLPDGTEVDGCDTVFAVYPEWRATWLKNTPQEVADQVNDYPQRVCITGGEPLIQAPVGMEELIWILRAKHHTIDLFTNGSKLLPPWALHRYVTVVMDYKLPGSGEHRSFDVANLDRLTPKDALKFVIKDQWDLETAFAFLAGNTIDTQLYFGPVWGTDPVWLAEQLTESGLVVKMNLQTHKYVFGDIRGT